jgi:luciferase family oxidoreductase group 1
MLDVGGRIEQALVLAPLVERLGYTRFWIAEHQPQPSPILVAAIVAGQTESIRVGTAGVLLHYHPPLRTAHDFRFLERVFPDRIDAGFCGGLIGDRAVADADREGRDLGAIVAAYPDRVAQLAGYLRDPHDDVLAWPFGNDVPPQIWSLGGGARSAELAARHGLSFGYALLYGNSVDDPATVRRYREAFVPHADLAAPAVAIAVCGVCAATDDEAEALAAPLDRSFFVARVIGSPQTCAARLAEIADRYDVDEIVFADLLSELDARMRCYELLAAVLATPA